MQENLLALLEDGLKDLSLKLSDIEKGQLIEYINLLLKWNKTYNLTSIKNELDALKLHILDCLSIINPLRDFLNNKEGNTQTKTVVDVGSGGGLPAIVLAIVMKNFSIYSVDAVEKKTAFVKAVASTLKLSNLKSIHTRIENFNIPEDIDIFISRAFASLDDYIGLVDPQCNGNSIVVAMKGKQPIDELNTLNKKHPEWKLIVDHELKVPGLDAERCLLIFKKG
ncbi:16S rRNA (guanine(527)-N(7))-methyltransferase RsmG [Taylorella equigenitalis]|uniref:16S rRNA (guanine(527)-N(7))-methyltransferase RsmG n=1 Tax=Taylorella equigenitalis TaxID=29575 RepID=UPI00237C58DD|nr:16S rRNA (guanine(527)-N(7))-methyltransferase RsmG [Taylorella equigenitalis]WDU54835.1 16S rRNA (guanine(527)-N(7))-methyltransferase RsmG [Taylorella equigenitalis]